MLHFKGNHLTVFQSSLFQTTSAVVLSDEAIVLTDPTWLPREIEQIKDYINHVRGERELYIIYTHSDFDHIIGAGAFPEAVVIASEEFHKQPQKEKVIEEIQDFDQQYYIERTHPLLYPNVDTIIQNGGEQVQVGGMTLTFYKAPGHTNDGLFTVVEPYGIFLSGDYLSDVEFPFITSSYQDYVQTIDKAAWILQNHEIHCHVPGHGSVANDLPKILDRIEFSKDYLLRLRNPDQQLEETLRSKYRFYEGMKSAHLENIEMAAKKE